jgi:hypothetical protein
MPTTAVTPSTMETTVIASCIRYLEKMDLAVNFPTSNRQLPNLAFGQTDLDVGSWELEIDKNRSA